MESSKTNMFGKTYNTIGSTESNFIIKTKGDLKVQWGNKFIDLIKSGKIVSQNLDILKIVSSEKDISSNGVYLIKDNDNYLVLIYINGNRVNLALFEETAYVSFLKELENSRDEKELALKNIGFYYDTLQEALKEVKSGIIFIKEQNKLYTVNNGILQEYNFNSQITYDSIEIGDIQISNQGINSKSKISLSINNLLYILLSNNSITFDKSIVVGTGVYILSYGANSDLGFRLYNNPDGSVLEVDKIIERDTEYSTLKENIYSKEYNIVESIIDEEDTIRCTLYYKNNFAKDLYVYILILELYIVTVSSDLENIIVSLNNPSPVSITCRIFYNNTNLIDITLESGELTKSVLVEDNVIINNYEFTQSLENVCFSTDLVNFKPSVKEVKIIESLGLDIIFNLESPYKELFINNGILSYVYLSNDTLIKIEDSNILVLDRTQLDNTSHTVIGEILENQIDELKKCNSDNTYPNVGILSDNIIGINPRLYDVMFSYICNYPKYDSSINIPEEYLSDLYNPVVPNIGWIKKLISNTIPSKVIVMYDGKSTIPDGWALCDGTNNTPDLTENFVKDSSTEETEGGGEVYTLVYIMKL